MAWSHLVHKDDGPLRSMQTLVQFDRAVRLCRAEVAIDLVTHGGMMSQRLEAHNVAVNEDSLGNAIASVLRS